jgi:D-xylose transport system substrate-binding protein
LNGETPKAKTTLYNTPSELFVPAVVTRGNIKAIVFDTGIASAAKVCTGRYAAPCLKLGIK